MCWLPGTPGTIKQHYGELEHEHPETLDGWITRFEVAGLYPVKGIDRSDFVRRWSRDTKREIGLFGQLKIGVAIFRR